MRSTSLLPLALGVLSLAAPSIANAREIVIQPDAYDRWMGHECGNGGVASTVMYVVHAAQPCWGASGLIRFDLSSLDVDADEIISAKLELYQFEAIGGNPAYGHTWRGFSAGAYPLNNAFTSTTTVGNATYRSGSGYQNAVALTQGAHWVSWPITTAVTEWVAGTQPNNGLRIVPIEDGVYSDQQATFAALLNLDATLRPRLVIQATDIVVDIDEDDDGVPDELDACPGHDDADDFDGDETPDGCDDCPSDFYGDSDGDGRCDSDDACALDAHDDIDGDGACADMDPCPYASDDDVDRDGICGNVDACPLDAFNDADMDGVCGNSDACPGGIDSYDADSDGTADFCDGCPDDAANDADRDGYCGDVDVCPLDSEDDIDGDGACADVDVCPADSYNDFDYDGICGDVDPCPVDTANDADGDGICESDDNCATVANSNQSDADGDTTGDACEPDNDGDGTVDDLDNCPLAANAAQLDSDHDSVGDVCDADDDGDGVLDAGDVCLSTPAGAIALDNGCSVAEQCLCSSPWKNHGAYVKCVAGATNELKAEGLITTAQKDAIQSAAGQSTCGHR
ncbi:MAG: thrombospondin type 3 repeat-containing protein [Myxococcota bacterium]